MAESSELLNITWLEEDDEDSQEEPTEAPGYRDGEVWDENWRAVLLFMRLITQWRMGPSGPIGLDYAVVPTVAREIAGIRKREMRDLWWPLQVMEGEALKWFADQRTDDD